MLLLLINNKKQVVDEEKVFVKPNFVFEENTNYNSSNELSEKDYNSKNKGYYSV